MYFIMCYNQSGGANMDILELIQASFDKYTNNELKIANYIINNPRQFCRKDIENITQAVGISKAGLIRFAKKLGFNGYIELRYEINRYLISNNTMDSSTNSQSDLIKIITTKYISSIEALNDSLDLDVIKKACQDLATVNRSKVFGLNKAGLAAKQFCYRVLNTYTEISHAIDDTALILDTVRTISEDDMIIIFTNNDNTGFYGRYFDEFSQTKAKIMVVTFADDLKFKNDVDYYFALPHNLMQYGTFLDLQAISYVFIEIFVSQLAKINGDK